jgi:hypothetical protein
MEKCFFYEYERITSLRKAGVLPELSGQALLARR